MRERLIVPENGRRTAAAALAATAAIAGFSGEAGASPAESASRTEITAVSHEQAQDPYKYAAKVLHAMNSGPINKNIIANGAIVLPAGTRVEKAPMHALKYRVPQDEVLFMQRFRLREQGGHLYAGAWQAHKPWKNQATDARHYLWVDLTEASKLPGYKAYNYADYNPDTSRDYPFTFPVITHNPVTGEKGNLFVVSPSNVSIWQEIAVPNTVADTFIDTELGFSNLVPAKKPVRFIKANPVPPINPTWAYNP